MDTLDSNPLGYIPRLSELSGHILCLPTMDRGTFTMLTSVPDIQAWTIAKADEHRQIALAFLAIHNLAAPIHRLPTEVLGNILERCWDDWESLRLPHVCRLWRSILLGRATFWADAVADCELLEKRLIARNDLPRVDALLSRASQCSQAIKPSFYTFTPSLAQSLTPYVSNVVSLEVALDKGDLQERLWPLLLSGIPNLEALEIQPMITKEDSEGYNEDTEQDALPNWYSAAWTSLPILSRKALPKLSHLTCPHNMVERFGDVPLRHLSVEWWDRAQETYQMPTVVLGEHGGLYLEPYRNTLETLEYVRARGYATSEQSLELPSLRCVYIDSDTTVVLQILSWLLFPQSTFIHIAGTTHVRCNVMTLRLLVRATDRVCLQHLRYHGQWDDYCLRCFAGDTERLRIEDLWTTRDDLLQFFGEDAPVTRLTLSVSSPGPDSGNRVVDLRIFPHLVHLDGWGFHMETMARMLQPKRDVQRSESVAGQAELVALPCPALAKLVVDIPCSNARATSSSSERCGPDTAAGDRADELFRQKCAVLQPLLADRASSGSRLAALHLRLRPSTVSDSNAPGSGSNDSADGGAVETSVVWPSRTVRQSIVQGLQVLVDGPIDFRFRRPNWWRDVFR
ncbi:hypothetical protein V8D89_003680 [Ganoderma adspersum]